MRNVRVVGGLGERFFIVLAEAIINAAVTTQSGRIDECILGIITRVSKGIELV